MEFNDSEPLYIQELADSRREILDGKSINGIQKILAFVN